MSGRSSHEQSSSSSSVQIQRAMAQREREQQARQFIAETGKGPITQSGGLHPLFSAPRKLENGDPTTRRILGEHDIAARNFDNAIGILNDSPQTPIPQRSRSLGFPFPHQVPPVNGIVVQNKVPSSDQKASSTATSRDHSTRSETSSSSHDREHHRREKDKRRSSKERASSGSSHDKSSQKLSNHVSKLSQNHHSEQSGHSSHEGSSQKLHTNQHHSSDHHRESKSHSPDGGIFEKLANSQNDSHVKSRKEETTPTKEAFHHPPNGVVLPNGALAQLKARIPKLQLPNQRTRTLSSETSQDVDDILKEMTCMFQPHNPIQTPIKVDKEFPFPAITPVENHVRNVFSTEAQSQRNPDKTLAKETNINGKIELNSDSEDEDLPDQKRTPKNKSSVTVSGGGGTVHVGPGGGGGGRTAAPFKENNNIKPMSSDESNGSGSESSSDGSESEDNSSDDEEEKKKEVEIPKPKTPPALISPPPSNEKKPSQTSWRLENFLPPPDCPSPGFTNANVSDKSLNGSFKEDPNNDLLDDLIPEIMENIGNSSDVDLDLDLEPQVPVNSNLRNSHNKNNFGNILDICSPGGGSSEDEFIPSSIDNRKSSNHFSQPFSSVHQVSDTDKRTSSASTTPSKSSSKKTKNETTPRKYKKQSDSRSTPQSEKKRKRTLNSKIESDTDDDFIDVEYFTPEKLDTKEESSADNLRTSSVVSKLNFSDCDNSKDVHGNINSVLNKTSSNSKDSKKSENSASKKCENKDSGKTVSDSVKSDSKNAKKSNTKTKEREKHKEKRRQKNKENKENEKSNISNSSMDRDIQEMINFKLLSPIPHMPDKLPAVASSEKPPVISSSEKHEDASLGKSMKYDEVRRDNRYDGLKFVNGKPSIVVSLDLSLFNNLHTQDVKNVFVNQESLDVKPETDSQSLVPGLDELDLSSPECRLNSSFSSQNSQKSATSHNNHIDSKKSTKRKQDCDRSEHSKRRKSSTKSASKRTATNTVIQTEKESHEDDHKWDRKWDERSRSDTKERHDSTSSNSSQHNGQLPKKSRNQIEDTELDKPSELEMKDEQLHSVTNSSEGQLSSVETFYDREGDMEAHAERLESADSYLAKAKELKHRADKLTDKLLKSMVYTEAILSFIQCGSAMERDQLSDVTKIYTMYRDTFRLLTQICRFRGNHEIELSDKEKILAVLSLRIQSIICLKLFKLKKAETLKCKRAIEDHNNKTSSSKPPAPPGHAPSPHQTSWNNRANGTPSPMSPVPPSPAGSIGSVGSQGSCNETPSKLPNGSIGASSASTSMSSPITVSIPQRIHSITQQYFNTTSFLVQCHDFWDQADTAMTDHREFFEDLDESCGPLSLHSSIPELVLYVQTGLQRIGPKIT